MASGILGASAPSATTNTTVYTVTSGKVGTFNVSFLNRGNTSATYRLAIAASGTPGNTEWLEYDTTVTANTVLERTGLIADAGKNVVVYTSSADTTVMVYGFEE